MSIQSDIQRKHSYALTIVLQPAYEEQFPAVDYLVLPSDRMHDQSLCTYPNRQLSLVLSTMLLCVKILRSASAIPLSTVLGSTLFISSHGSLKLLIVAFDHQEPHLC